MVKKLTSDLFKAMSRLSQRLGAVTDEPNSTSTFPFAFHPIAPGRADEPDEEAMLQMQSDVLGTLLYLKRKSQNGDSLSRTEWAFLGRYSNRSYDQSFHRISLIDSVLLTDNLLAFAAVIRLRGQLNDNTGSNSDDYYLGNLNVTWVREEEFPSRRPATMEKVSSLIEGLTSTYTTIGAACFSSRNLDYALSHGPALNISELNDALRPYLKSMLTVCLYGYWGDLNNDFDIAYQRFEASGMALSNNMIALPVLKNEHFHISPHAGGTKISCAISANHHPFVFALNDYRELMHFVSLVSGITEKNSHTSVPDFELFVPAVPPRHQKRYVTLASGRWRHMFTIEEFQALKQLLCDFCAEPAIASHLQELELIYGRI